MHLPVTVGVEEDKIVHAVLTAFRSPDDVMTVPSLDLGDRLGADGTDAPLFLPEMEQLPFPGEVGLHLDAKALFEVDLPGGIVWIGSCFNLSMPFDRHLRRREEPDWSGLALLVAVFPGEDPPAIALRAEVLILDPGLVLFGMPSPCPLPQDLEDGGVYGAKGFLTGVVSVIGSPSPDNRIEQTDQVFDLCLLVGLDDSSDLLQERVHVLAGRLGDVFAVVLAYMVSEEIEAVVYAGDDCLFLREFQPAFLHELLHEGFDLTFQQLFRGAGDDEVVGIPDHVHLAAIGCLAVWRGELLLEPAFETIKRKVGQDRGAHSPYKVANFFFRGQDRPGTDRSETQY